MKYPLERQLDLKDCGVCSLSMLVKYYGGGVSKEYLRNLTNTTKNGVTAYDLLAGAKKLGFSGYGVKGDFSLLNPENLPCIAHVIKKKSYQHFLVIYEINKKKKWLLIADPDKKELEKVSFAKFSKLTTNHFLFLKPEKKIQYTAKNAVMKEILLQFLWKNKKFLMIIILFSVGFTFLNIICSFQMNFLLNLVVSFQSFTNLLNFIFLFTVIIFLKEYCNHYRNFLMNQLSHRLDKMLFQNVYHHLLSLPYLYYKNRTTGEVLTRIEDIVKIREMFSKLFTTIFLDILLASFTLGTLFFLQSRLTILLIILIFLLSLIVLCFQKPLERKIRLGKETSSQLTSFLTETISGIETIKNQNIEDYIQQNFLLKYSNYQKNSICYNQLFLKENFLQKLITECGIFFLTGIGIYFVMKKDMSLAFLLTYLQLAGYLLEPIQNMIHSFLELKDTKISFDRISELYEIEEDVSLKSLKKKQIQEIQVSHLNYGYRPRNFLLTDINMKIHLGEKILIYGSSGSGKSTLAKLLSKNLMSENKMIFYDGIDMNFFATAEIKKKICYLSQQETLFTDSIYQNIVLDQNVDDDTFLLIAKLCKVNEIVEDNILAYDMLLEENEFNISGGQRQRILLARALLKNADFYILDESLNEVDIQKEREILEGVFQTYPNKTFLVISHRFHNQDLFSKRYRIENGVSYEE